MTEKASGIEIRPLRSAEVDSAVDLVAESITEIPQFQWLLGRHLADPAVSRWFATFLVAPHVPIDRVEAAVHADGSVGGVVVWTAPDLPDQPLPPALEAVSADILRTRPDILDRLREFQTVAVAERLPGDHAHILLAVVAPGIRRTGVPARLTMRARQAAADAGLGAALIATDRALGQSYERTYGAVLQKEYQVGTVTNYAYYVSPEQVRSGLLDYS